MPILMKFLNRHIELKTLNEEFSQKELIILTGRRRIGKTTLVLEWGKAQRTTTLYTQAIESSPPIQLRHVWQDIQEGLPAQVEPKSWEELFSLVNAIADPVILVIDEFPYLVKSDSSLASRFQKWIDHAKPKHVALCLLGSSQSLMTKIFLDDSAPLYMRARRVIRVEPLSYRCFTQALNLPAHEKETFIKFSLVGGVPRYWELIDPSLDAVALASQLYFGPQAFLENEYLRLMKDENVERTSFSSILDAIGNGAHRSNEIASLLRAKQTSLSRALAVLSSTGLVTREVPFGQSHRNTKKTSYHITDPYLAFHYNVFSPHRSRWFAYDREKRNKLLLDHASTIFERHYRAHLPSAARYFEAHREFDALHQVSDQEIQVTEIKFREVSTSEKQRLLGRLQASFEQSKIYHRESKHRFRYKVVDLAEGLERFLLED